MQKGGGDRGEAPVRREPAATAALAASIAAGGLASVALEVTAVRVMGPVFGTSLYTWTHVIAVVLASLALGSWVGGRMAARGGAAAELGRMFAGAALFLLPAPLLAVPLGAWLLPAPDSLTPFVAAPHLVRGSLAGAALLFALPSLLIGAAGPLAMRALLDCGLAPGAAAGRALWLATAGGLAGSLAPSLGGWRLLGARGVLFACALVLALAGLRLARGRTRWIAIAAATLALGGAAADRSWPIRGRIGSGTDAGEMEVLREVDSDYQYVRVSKWRVPLASGAGTATELRLSLDEGVTEYHSLLREGALLTGAYYDFFAWLPVLVAPGEGPLRAAVIGGGAGTMPRLWREAFGRDVAPIVNVELDPEVLAESSRFGWQPGSGGRDGSPVDRNVAGDGRAVLRALSERFDLIVLDAYARQVAIPPHLATLEWFRVVADHLAPRGLFAINVSVPSVEGPLARSLAATLGAVFPSVAAISVPGTWNLVLLASTETAHAFRPHARAFASPAAGEALRSVGAQALSGLFDARPLGAGAPLLSDDRAPLERLARLR